jgi:hypothetical protein
MITQSQPSGYRTTANWYAAEEGARCDQRLAASVEPRRLLVSVVH